MHMSCEKTCNMQHRAKKRAKTMQNHAMQNHVMQNHVMQNHVMPKPCKKQAVPHVAKNKLFHMQKPCKMRRVRSANPPNIHSPRVPCYMCYMCYISQGKPLNIHSPRVPCYMCYMCYMALYSTYTADFARTEHIAHIVHIARSRGRVGVQRLGV